MKTGKYKRWRSALLTLIVCGGMLLPQISQAGVSLGFNIGPYGHSGVVIRFGHGGYGYRGYRGYYGYGYRPRLRHYGRPYVGYGYRHHRPRYSTPRYFGPRYFGPRYFGPRYFGPRPRHRHHHRH